jgi:hypothetical protein
LRNAFSFRPKEVMQLTALTMARALGGVVSSNTSVSAPGPGHNSTDRSLSIKLDTTG